MIGLLLSNALNRIKAMNHKEMTAMIIVRSRRYCIWMTSSYDWVSSTTS